MSILGKIFGKIFPSSKANDGAADATVAGGQPSVPASTASAGPAATPSGQPGQPSAAMPQVDVEAMLNDMALKSPEKLNWRTSIVDLMKLLGLDSSLEERKALARELGYTGNTGDSASMNLWLHKQVMQKLAANGGRVPAELLD